MLHRAFRPITFALLELTVLAAGASAQTSPDSVRIARLAGLGKLWAAVKYFHPALVTQPIDWDSALVSAIPKVRAARTRDDYVRAVDDMLAALKDPDTHVHKPRPTVQLAAPAPSGTRWTEDSTFIITVANPTDVYGTIGSLNMARPDIMRARRVIFDLRTHGVDRESGYMSYILGANTGVAGLFSSTPVTAPSLRTRMYSGFPTQSGGTSGGYWAGFSIRSGDVVRPAAGNTVTRRVGFIIDEYSDLPPIALALQQAGLGVIVAEGALAGNIDRENGWTMTLPDSVNVAVRVTQAVNADGTAMGQPDTIVVPHGGGDPALNAALALVRAPARTRSARAATSSFTPPPEKSYPEMRSPGLEYRLLAALRYWSAIQYFYPYKSLMGEDWNQVLAWAIPQFEAANDSTSYALAIAALVTKIHDSHGFVNSNALRLWFGAVAAPVKLKYVEGKPVVIEVSADTSVQSSGIRVGDVVVSIDGVTAAARRARIEPYIASSTPQALDRTVATRLLSGAEGSVAELVVRGADNRDRTVRITRRALLLRDMRWTRPGPNWKILPGNIGYVDMEKLTVPQVDSMFDALKDTKAIIFDNRSYPQGTAWPVAPRLTDRQDVVGARFQRPLVMTPDTTQWSTYAFVQPLPRTNKSRYRNPTVMLVDENTISQAEHTGLFFEAANGTKFIGSPTMGANGDITQVVFPGGITASFTGHDVRHADGRQLQRVGLQPDVLVKPSIAGIRAGKDEVLERAVRFIQTGR